MPPSPHLRASAPPGRYGREREAAKLHSQLTAPAESADAKGKKKPHKLGTVKGVLIPTCENMWGVIIFLRFFLIAGNCGLGYSLLICVMSFLVSFITANSLAAIATCGTSAGLGGVYPMLRRALGKEVATAVGLVYFLGIVLLVSIVLLV